MANYENQKEELAYVDLNWWVPKVTGNLKVLSWNCECPKQRNI